MRVSLGVPIIGNIRRGEYRDAIMPPKRRKASFFKIKPNFSI
jgi:hypothetical protein